MAAMTEMPGSAKDVLAGSLGIVTRNYVLTRGELSRK